MSSNADIQKNSFGGSGTDTSRCQRKFESLISDMSKTFDGWVIEFEANDIEGISSKIEALEPRAKPRVQEFLSWLEEFLSTNTSER